MIANNIFRAIGDFFTNVLFQPFESLRLMDNWWLQSTISWIFVGLSFIFFFYWLGQIQKYKKAGNE